MLTSAVRRLSTRFVSARDSAGVACLAESVNNVPSRNRSAPASMICVVLLLPTEDNGDRTVPGGHEKRLSV